VTIQGSFKEKGDADRMAAAITKLKAVAVLRGLTLSEVILRLCEREAATIEERFPNVRGL
jgi:hypothetical protein